MGFYETEKLSDRLYKIVDLASKESFPIQNYLVLGDVKAALIDSGLGIGNIRQVVEAITSLPVLVLHTHGHPDHIGGDPLFEENYLSPLENVGTLEERKNANEDKKRLIEGFAGNNPELVKTLVESFVPAAEVSYKPVHDGDAFDLGEVVLEAVAIPGHTQGSLAYVDQKGRFAFTGDGIADIHWFDGDMYFNTVESFYETLRHFEDHARNARQIYAAHISKSFELSLVRHLQTAAQNILNGSRDPVENADYLFLKHGELHVHRVENVKIYYKPENIRKAG